MKRNLHNKILLVNSSVIVLLLSIFFPGVGVVAQKSIENAYYLVRPATDFSRLPAFIVTDKASRIERRIVPGLRLVFTQDQPQLLPSTLDGQPGVVAWSKKGGTTQDIHDLGSTELIAQSYILHRNTLVFQFKDNENAQVGLIVKFIPDQQAPIFELSLLAHRQGNYSLGFCGMPEVDSAAIDFVYQPLTWSWKRFPGRFALTEEAYANTAAVFTNHHGITEGLAVYPGDIPYRFALAAQWNNAGKPDNKFWSVFPADGPKGNSLFGMAIRNPAGNAQPLIFSPLPGTSAALLKKGERRSIRLVYLLQPGNWQQGSGYLLSNIFHYRSERQNVRVSLNQTLDNMLELAMNDKYSGWNEELKGSNYQFDVPGTVKNVSALHPLGMYLFTGDEAILKRRAIPMIEYLMSREKFLYTTSDTPGQAQQPSHMLKGPSVDIGELAGLDALTKGNTPAFAMEAARLFGKSRQLNMNTQTGGGSWQDYLARYRLTHSKDDLQKATDGTNTYLRQVYTNYSRTFFDSPGLRDKGAGFTTDYGLRIYDLFELYLDTRNEVYLNAANTGARQLLLWTRSNPSPPATDITVNKKGVVKGIFPGRRVSAIEGAPFVPMNETTHINEKKLPAWQTSLNGLIPEAPNTYAFGPVMLAHHAAWLLRLAHYSKDTLLRNAAYNAVIGRYANFPGYYFTSLHTDVYQHADYPMHPFNEVKYNAIFYNHIWPHLALLADFLVADFFYRSGGMISFPGTYAPGYAFLTSQVYGAKKGTVMGYGNVQLWMPRHAIKTDNIAFNYLMGHNEKDLFIAFANTFSKPATEQITLNNKVVFFNPARRYEVVVYDQKGRSRNLNMQNGRLSVSLPAGGLSTFVIRDIYRSNNSEASYHRRANVNNRFIRYQATTDSSANATAMLIQPNEKMAVFYLYSDQTEKQWRNAVLRYRFAGDTQWHTIADNSYPFEFDVALPAPDTPITFELTGTRLNGSMASFPVKQLNN